MSAMNERDPEQQELSPELLELSGSEQLDLAEMLARFLPAVETAAVPSRVHHVTAVMVSHNGSAWLPRALDALAGQQRPPEASYAVDAGSLDGSIELLQRAEAVGHLGAVRTSPSRNWAEGVNAVLAAHPAPALPAGSEAIRWVWVLHDDCAPEPACLAALLRHADHFPEAAVVGPKAVSWADRTRLVDAGRSWAPGAPQVARVERGERDQGQHDHPVAVYALGSAGLLARADLLADLGGFDPDAPGDAAAADLCRQAWARGHQVWLAPSGVLAHRRAGQMCVRPGSDAFGQRRAARAGQLYLDLTQAPALALPWRGLRAVTTTTLRALGLLVTRDPREAAGEVRGLVDVLGHPRRWRDARARWRVSGRFLTRPPELRAPRWAVARHAWDSWNAASPAAARRARPTSVAAPGWPWLFPAVVVVLTVAALIANSQLLLGPGSIQGGGLLPAPGSGELLASYWRDWHGVGFGSSRAAPAYLPLLGLCAIPLFGSVDLLLRLLLGLYVPLAFVSAYLGLGGRWPAAQRLALATAYAWLPAGLAASASGRLSTVALGLLGPPTVRVLWAALGAAGSVRRASWAGLLAGVTVSFAPAAWLLLAGAAAAQLIRNRRAGTDLGRRWAVGLSCAALVNALWLPELFAHPSLALFEVGVNSPGLLGSAGRGWVLGLSPGGLGAPPWWAGIPLLLLALGAAGQAGTAPALRSLWVAIGGLAAAAVTSLPKLPMPWATAANGQHPWSGQWLLLAGAALILTIGLLASTTGAGGVRLWSGPRWLTAAGLGAGLALAAGWAAAAPGATGASAEAVMPAVAAAAATGPEAPRVLLLRRDSVTQAVAYFLSSGAGARLGDADVAAAGPAAEEFDRAVTGMVASAGMDVGAQLAPRAVGYVVFTGDQADPVVSALDSAVGLRRLSSGSDQALWLVTGHAARAQLQPAAAAPDEAPVPIPVRLDRQLSLAVVLHPQLRFPRELAVAERMAPGWRLVVAGHSVPMVADPATGLLKAELADPGELRLNYHGWRWLAGTAQLGLLVAVVLLALPKRAGSDP